MLKVTQIESKDKKEPKCTNWRNMRKPKQVMPAFTISFLIKAKIFFEKY